MGERILFLSAQITIIISVLALFIGCIWLAGFVAGDTYKQGQIDCIEGNIKYEKVQTDSWREKK